MRARDLRVALGLDWDDWRRFMAKVTLGHARGCWIWTGAKNGDGYGCFGAHGVMCSAHRLTWMRYCGDPGQQCVLHSCDTPACVNPYHLYLGSPGDNARDREQRGRGNHQHGERHGRAKFTAQQVVEIRQSSLSHREEAIRRGVSRTAIRNIRTHRVWRHVA